MPEAATTTASTTGSLTADVDLPPPEHPPDPHVRRPLVSPAVLVALCVAAGLALCAWTEDLSRATLAPSPWMYWAGVALIVGPITFRATAPVMGSIERVGLVCLEGVALYMARLFRDPSGFTLPDEFPHALSLQLIVSRHHLFNPNPLLPIVTHFPGLEGATSALMTLTGMSSWGSALLFILFARLTLSLALFSVFAALTRSGRAAALGAILFAANSNYLMWESQYAYESLSLPLLLMLLAALAERERTPRVGGVGAWGIVAALTIVVIVPTHHLTSYLTAGTLWLACLSRLALPGRIGGRIGALAIQRRQPLWPFALLATSLVAAWLVVVSSQTVGYLTPAVQSAIQSALRTLSGEGPAHALFASAGTAIGSNNLISEEAISFLEPVVLLIALPVGLRALWRRGSRPEPLIWILSLFGVAYFGVTVLRFVPSAWEISNRTAEFMFIGMAFVAGGVAIRHLKLIWQTAFRRALASIVVAACVIGGAVAGWPANSRLAKPIEVTASNGASIYSQAEAVGRWFARQPPGAVAAPDADSFTINLYGHHVAWTGYSYNVDPILTSPGPVAPWMMAELGRAHVRYVVVDTRQNAVDNVVGLFFNLLPPAGSPDELNSPSLLTRWSSLGSRVYDSGEVVVFDLARRP